MRHASSAREAVPAREFDRRKRDDGAAELSLDLGPQPGEHNQIRIETTGQNYRRRVRLESSANLEGWQGVILNGEIAAFVVGSETLDVRRLSYPASRQRYLRVNVWPDPAEPKPQAAAMAVGSCEVFRQAETPGEYVAWPVKVSDREPTTDGGVPSSRWWLDVGPTAPAEVLTVVTREMGYTRPYRVERLDTPRRTELISGRLRCPDGLPVGLRFPETRVDRLVLVVNDSRNPPLRISSVMATAAVRQVVFRPTDGVGPFRLYFGNPEATAPNYDFAQTVWGRLAAPPTRLTFIEEPRENPARSPQPKPLSERVPWLVYAVLGLACLSQAYILLGVVRTVVRRHDTMTPTTAGDAPAVVSAQSSVASPTAPPSPVEPTSPGHPPVSGANTPPVG